MSKYDSQLSSLTLAEIVARLDGQGGLLALTERELFFIDDTTHQTARLSSIKRIGVNKETGKVDVSGESGPLMEISPRAFQRDELKQFLESLKSHVLRAKSMPTQVGEPPRPVPVPIEPEPTPEPQPIAKPEPVQSLQRDPQTLEEPLSAPTPQESLPEKPAAPNLSSSAINPAINIVEPPRTLPDEPSDSIWAYEGAPKTEPEHKSAPVPPAPNPVMDNLTIPPPPYIGPTPTPVRRGGMVWLKVWALVTLVFVLGYLYAYFTNLLPNSSVWSLLETVVIGVGLAGIQWRLSEPL